MEDNKAERTVKTVGLFQVIVATFLTVFILTGAAAFALYKYKERIIPLFSVSVDQAHIAQIVRQEVSSAVANGLSSSSGVTLKDIDTAIDSSMTKSLTDMESRIAKKITSLLGSMQSSPQNIPVINNDAVLSAARDAVKEGNSDLAALLYTRSLIGAPIDPKIIDEFLSFSLKELDAIDDEDMLQEELESLSLVFRNALMVADVSEINNLAGALDKIGKYYSDRTANANSDNESNVQSTQDLLVEYRNSVSKIDTNNLSNYTANMQALNEAAEALNGGIYGPDGDQLLIEINNKIEQLTINSYFANNLDLLEKTFERAKNESKQEYSDVLLTNISQTMSELIAMRYNVSPSLVAKLDALVDDVRSFANSKAARLNDDAQKKIAEQVRKYNKWAISTIRDSNSTYDRQMDDVPTMALPGTKDKQRKDIAYRCLTGNYAKIEVSYLEPSVALLYQEVQRKFYEYIKDDVDLMMRVANSVSSTTRLTPEDI